MSWQQQNFSPSHGHQPMPNSSQPQYSMYGGPGSTGSQVNSMNTINNFQQLPQQTPHNYNPQTQNNNSYENEPSFRQYQAQSPQPNNFYQQQQHQQQPMQPMQQQQQPMQPMQQQQQQQPMQPMQQQQQPMQPMQPMQQQQQQQPMQPMQPMQPINQQPTHPMQSSGMQYQQQPSMNQQQTYQMHPPNQMQPLQPTQQQPQPTYPMQPTQQQTPKQMPMNQQPTYPMQPVNQQPINQQPQQQMQSSGMQYQQLQRNNSHILQNQSMNGQQTTMNQQPTYPMHPIQPMNQQQPQQQMSMNQQPTYPIQPMQPAQQQPINQQPTYQMQPNQQQPLKQMPMNQNPTYPMQPAQQQPMQQMKPMNQQPMQQQTPINQQPTYPMQPIQQQMKPMNQQPIQQQIPMNQQPTYPMQPTQQPTYPMQPTQQQTPMNQQPTYAMQPMQPAQQQPQQQIPINQPMQPGPIQQPAQQQPMNQPPQSQNYHPSAPNIQQLPKQSLQQPVQQPPNPMNQPPQLQNYHPSAPKQQLNPMNQPPQSQHYHPSAPNIQQLPKQSLQQPVQQPPNPMNQPPQLQNYHPSPSNVPRSVSPNQGHFAQPVNPNPPYPQHQPSSQYLSPSNPSVPHANPHVMRQSPIMQQLQMQLDNNTSSASPSHDDNVGSKSPRATGPPAGAGGATGPSTGRLSPQKPSSTPSTLSSALSSTLLSRSSSSSLSSNPRSHRASVSSGDMLSSMLMNPESESSKHGSGASGGGSSNVPSSLLDIASSATPTSKEAIKAAKYSQYISTGESFSDLPSDLFRTKRLHMHTISITSSRLNKMSSKLNTLSSLTNLTLRSSQITVISGIEKLSQLVRLDLGENKISIVPEWLNGSNFPKLNLINFDKNSINILPPSFASLTSLMSLNLSSNYLTNLDLKSFVGLRELVISHNNLFSLPPIENCSELQLLDCGFNKLQSLPREVFCLQKLTSLIVTGNRLSVMPPEIVNCQRLLILHWDDNRLNHIPETLFSLYRLNELKVSKNNLQHLSQRVSNLTCLRKLDLDSNKFDTLPFQVATLPNLSEANLTFNDNPLESIPKEVRVLGHASIVRFLRQLNNKAPWRRMKLMLVGNGNIGKTSLKRALSQGNLSSSHPSGLTEKKEKLKNFANKINKKVQAKIGLQSDDNINQTNSSNPSLNEEQVSSTFDPTDTIATDGIDIDDWEVDLNDYPELLPNNNNNNNTTNANSNHSNTSSPSLSNSEGPESNRSRSAIFSCYDFAGQDVYYPTHSLFITSRSIYLVMFSFKDLESSRVEYWLQMVFAKSQYSSPVIIVGTHEDHKSVDKKSIPEILTQLKKKYARFAFVKDVVSVSSKTGNGVARLRQLIISLALKHPTMKEEVPGSYLLLESEIKNRRKSGVQTLSRKEWNEMSEKCSIKNEEEQKAALDFMADVGVVFHFKGDDDDNLDSADQAGSQHLSENNSSTTLSNRASNASVGRKLDDVVILDPQWIADLLSTVISLKHNYIKEGTLEASVLPQLWKTYPSDIHASLLDLLIKFEIIHPMGGDRYMVPSMLPTSKDEQISKTWAHFSPSHLLASNSINNSPSNTPNNDQNQNNNAEVTWYSPMCRIVQFRFLPMGFFGRLISRLIHLPNLSTIFFSTSCFICETSKIALSPPHSNILERCLVAYNEFSSSILLWSMSHTPPDSSNRPRNLLYSIMDCLDVLYESLYASNRRNVWLACSHCISNGISEPTLFDFDDALIAVSDGIDYLKCQKSNHSKGEQQPKSLQIQPQPQALPSLPPYKSSYKIFSDFLSRKSKFTSTIFDDGEGFEKVAISSMASDMNFSSLGDMLVPYEDLIMDKHIATGGFAEIYLGSFKPLTAAEKSSGNRPPSRSEGSAFRPSTSNRKLKTSHPPHLDGQTFAIKKFLRQENSTEMSEAFRELQHEAFLMSKLNHPNLVRLHALCTKPFCMIMEYVPCGALGDYLPPNSEKYRKFDWNFRLKCALDMACGLAYLHSEGIVHLDFRSPNLLLQSLQYDVPLQAASPLNKFNRASSNDSSLQLNPTYDMNSTVLVKVADFGLSTYESGGLKGLKAFNCFWSSPEIILNQSYGIKTDMYSFGIVCWELLQTGRPFEEYQERYRGGPEIIFAKAIAGGLRPSIPPNTPQPFKQLIEQCWSRNPEDRPSSEEAFIAISKMIAENQTNPWQSN